MRFVLIFLFLIGLSTVVKGAVVSVVAPSMYPVDKDVTVTVKADSVTDLGYLKIVLTYDTSKLDYKGFAKGNAFSDWTKFEVKAENNKITVAGEIGEGTPVTGDGIVIIQLKFTTKGIGTAEIDIDSQRSYLKDVGKSEIAVTWKGTKIDVGLPQIVAYVPESVAKDKTCTVEVRGEYLYDIAAFQFTIDYDQNYLKMEDVKLGDDLSDWTLVERDDGDKLKIVAFYYPSGQTFTGSGTLLMIKFKATDSGNPDWSRFFDSVKFSDSNAKDATPHNVSVRFISNVTYAKVYLELNESDSEITANVIVLNAKDLSAFQIDVIYKNLEVLKVEKGRDIEHWSFFFYKVFDDNRTRIVATRLKTEKTIDEGVIAIIHFKRLSSPISINISGQLSNEDAEQIPAQWFNYTENVSSTPSNMSVKMSSKEVVEEERKESEVRERSYEHSSVSTPRTSGVVVRTVSSLNVGVVTTAKESTKVKNTKEEKTLSPPIPDEYDVKPTQTYAKETTNVSYVSYVSDEEGYYNFENIVVITLSLVMLLLILIYIKKII